jgi:hypothetical protein
MATTINFPSSPAINTTYAYGNVTYKYNGTRWYIFTIEGMSDLLSVVTPVGIVHTANTSISKNFLINALSSANTIAMSNLSTAIGQTGLITIKNPSSGTISFNQLPAYMKTPSGADINFVVDVNAVSIISYFIIDASTVICNYIGDLK